MRADRLLSILMLLQTNGKMSAPALARELEISVRSIYRDIDALSAAGIPVYAERGVNGGCSLLDGYRSSLTGLTREEIKALFALGIPTSLDDLGISNEIKSALRKLSGSLAEQQSRGESRRIYIDWSDRSYPRRSQPCLQNIYRAVLDNSEMRLSYYEMIGPLRHRFERTVDPYGLVAQANEWNLVCAERGRLYFYRVSDIQSVETTGKNFDLPVDFNLIEIWNSYKIKEGSLLPSFSTLVRIAPNLTRFVSQGYESRLYEAITREKTIENDGSFKTILVFDSFDDARRYVLGFGGALEVLEPEALRLSVIDHAQQTLSLYESFSDRRSNKPQF